ncbi:MAG: hypothetical protein EXS13_07095 [Planctomycetes bacterium]|nr:hypothetical protein [Planctomycetota bacterium]
MKKLVPMLRLAAFCFVLFGISAMAVLLKQGRLFSDAKAKADAEHADPELAKAGLEPEPKGGSADHAQSKLASGTDESKREASVAAGRTLFDLPESISIPEASELMLELKREKQDNDARKAVLDQREKELQAMGREIETRRSEVLGMAKKLKLDAPLAAVVPTAADYDPETLKEVAKIVSGMESNAAGKMISAMPAEKAALLLLQMTAEEAASILSQVDAEKVFKLTEMLMKAPRGG